MFFYLLYNSVLLGPIALAAACSIPFFYFYYGCFASPLPYSLTAWSSQTQPLPFLLRIILDVYLTTMKRIGRSGGRVRDRCASIYNISYNVCVWKTDWFSYCLFNSEKGCESWFPYCFLTVLTKLFLWGRTLLDFGFLAEEASWIHRIFKIWCNSIKKFV